MRFEYRELPPGKKQRLSCPRCGNVLLFVDYEPVHKKKGKHQVGHYGTCSLCSFNGRISAGHRK